MNMKTYKSPKTAIQVMETVHSLCISMNGKEQPGGNPQLAPMGIEE